jgi:hypothetical protein
MENKFDRGEIVAALKKTICRVAFTKTNGDMRVMYCTLQESVLPAAPEESSETTRKRSEDVVSAWDVEKNAWRSFRVDSITDFGVPDL